MFTLFQWSDNHNNSTTTQATNKLIDAIDVDCVVHCGDVCRAWFEEGTGNTDFSKSLFIVGNHDSILNSGIISNGNDWSKQPTQTQLYNRYTKNNVTYFNAEVPTNCAWWRKTYADSKICVLGLFDCVVDSTTYNSEAAFVTETLELCEQNGYSLVVIKHGGVYGSTILTCNFTSKLGETTGNYETNQYHNATSYNYCTQLEKLILNQTKVTVKCFLMGHQHYDQFGYALRSDGVKIPCIHVNGTLIDEYQDVPRSSDIGKINAVVANYIELSDENTMRIYRLGASGSALGCRRKMLVWDYDTGTIVNQCSYRG